MTLNELLPTLHALPRVEKLRLIQVMAADVAREDVVGLPDADKSYPIWSPYDAFEGAAALSRVLREEQGGQRNRRASVFPTLK
jgi:hypothetical protein